MAEEVNEITISLDDLKKEVKDFFENDYELEDIIDFDEEDYEKVVDEWLDEFVNNLYRKYKQ